MSVVSVDTRKWPDRRHWQYQAQRLGEDEHGAWLHVPADTVAQRGHEPPQRLEVGFVAVVPDNEWWVVEFYWDHPRHVVYVNIGTPPQWDQDRIRQIDLDLDVVRNVDGTVEVLDEEEFAQHQQEYAYPANLVTAARRAADRAVALLETDTEPFGAAPLKWQAAAGHG